MKRFAAIDIGASALKLKIAQIDPRDKTPQILEKLTYPLRLGKDTFMEGVISPRTLSQAIEVLEGFKRKLTEYEIDGLQIVATSAVREARNRDFFVEQVKLKTGLQVEVIERSEEQRLIFLGLRYQLPKYEEMIKKGVLFLKTGSGNIEIFLFKKGNLLFSATIPIGGLRLRETLKEVPEEYFYHAVESYINSELKMLSQSLPIVEIKYFVGAGTLLKSIMDNNETQKNYISTRQLKKVYDQLRQRSRAQIAEKMHIPLEYADLVLPSTYTYWKFLDQNKLDGLTFQDMSFSDSLILNLSGAFAGGYLRKKIWRSAIRIGRKYKFDEKHALEVSRLALQIFDGLQPIHSLPSRRFRFILTLAALWHDIGIFIKNNSHHKHSFYLISNLEMPGLSRKDMHLIATIARYHRKNLPQKYHKEYALLDAHDKVIVLKLAAFLRLADALDRSHAQPFENLGIEILEEKILFKVKAKGDIWLEKIYFRKKKELFEQVFGITLELVEDRLL